jgi:large subunit ribosomal protein L15
MKLHDLKPAPGSHTPARRVGRGHGSGKGKTAGRGTKGQKSRAGASIPAWFEGGQTPLHVRTPKLHGFRNRGRVEYAAVNLSRLTDAEAGTLITPDVLVHDGLVRRSKSKAQPVKILGVGEAPKGVTIHAHAFSRSALDKLAAAGSTAQRISWPEGNPIDEEAEARAAAEAAEASAAAADRKKAKTTSADSADEDETPEEARDEYEAASRAARDEEADGEGATE